MPTRPKSKNVKHQIKEIFDRIAIMVRHEQVEEKELARCSMEPILYGFQYDAVTFTVIDHWDDFSVEIATTEDKVTGLPPFPWTQEQEDVRRNAAENPRRRRAPVSVCGQSRSGP